MAAWLGDMQEENPPTTAVMTRAEPVIPQAYCCAICCDLLVDPTTLGCGHSYCLLCLARSTLTSNKKQCAECRQLWTELPQVNVSLRSVIEEHFGEQLYIRRTNETTPENLKLINHFKNQFRHEAPQPETKWSRYLKYFKSSSLATYVVIFLIVQLFAYMWSSPEQKHLSKWTTNDVTVWLREIGPWTEKEIIPRFEADAVNGMLLSALKEDDLMEMLPNTSSSHIDALNVALAHIQFNGIKPPTNLWEYRSLHPGKTAFLVSVVYQYPRLMFVYLFLFDYSDGFLPIIHATEPVLPNLDEINLYVAKLPAPTLVQWFGFLVKMIVLPALIIIPFAYRVAGWFTFMLLLSTLLVVTYGEASLFWIVASGRLEAHRVVNIDVFFSHVRQFCPSILTLILWPLIPNFLVSLHFYLYYLYVPLCTLLGATFGRQILAWCNKVNDLARQQQEEEARRRARVEAVFRPVAGLLNQPLADRRYVTHF